MTKRIQVSVPLPMRQTFDFILGDDQAEPPVGARVRVPFGQRELIGIVSDFRAESEYPLDKLKPIKEVLDKESVFSPNLWRILRWISAYYLAPIGEVLDLALPVKLRQGEAVEPMQKVRWRLSEHGRSSPIEELQRAPLQLALVRRLIKADDLGVEDFKTEKGGWRSALKTLKEKGWVDEITEVPKPFNAEPRLEKNGSGLTLSEQQAYCVEQLGAHIESNSYSCSLLHGVTGSGKTEVYFAAMQSVLAQGKQVLLMVPEIGLTPQLMERIEAAFNVPIVSLHSGMNDTQRHLSWWHARQGEAKVIVGTRSAVFTPFENLGLIVVDEEHDASFKQQDGVRYHARDVAIYRARLAQIPIVLGSATPSLESFHNAQLGRYTLLELADRVTDAPLPQIHLLDMNLMPSPDGLSPAMIEAVQSTIANKQQALLFINRRGFAPVLYCSGCSKTVSCHRCDSNLTIHRRSNRMRCHHCGYESRVLESCQSCGHSELLEIGEGTQRIEEALAQRIPKASLARIDRDSTSRRGELETALQAAKTGEVDIIVGTQLLTKGHDFPNVGMVGILGIDQGLHSTDFRASETTFQQIVQVAGRAGRRETTGRVFIQTAFPQLPFFEFVRNHDYHGYAELLMAQREAARHPPFGYFVLLRAESTHQAKALQFLRRAKSELNATEGIRVMDAVPAPMEKRAGRYRAQLLVSGSDRKELNAVFSAWLKNLENNAEAKKLAATVRWSIDVDPIDHS